MNPLRHDIRPLAACMPADQVLARFISCSHMTNSHHELRRLTADSSSLRCKKYPLSTDILWPVFRILTEPVPYTFVFVNQRNTEARAHIVVWACASLFLRIRKTRHKISVDIYEYFLQCTHIALPSPANEMREFITGSICWRLDERDVAYTAYLLRTCCWRLTSCAAIHNKTNQWSLSISCLTCRLRNSVETCLSHSGRAGQQSWGHRRSPTNMATSY